MWVDDFLDYDFNCLNQDLQDLQDKCKINICKVLGNQL